ncbi:MAG: hypothetical protein WDA17_03245 [Sphaerochaetaceae bacterium]
MDQIDYLLVFEDHNGNFEEDIASGEEIQIASAAEYSPAVTLNLTSV